MTFINSTKYSMLPIHLVQENGIHYRYCWACCETHQSWPCRIILFLAGLLQHHKTDRPSVNHDPLQGWVGKWKCIAIEDVAQLEKLEV